jgi:hypothetical protein
MPRKRRNNIANFGAMTLEQHVDYIDDLSEEVLDRIDESLEAGELTEAEAVELVEDLEDEYDDRLEEIEAAYEDGEIVSEEESYDDDDEDADYSGGIDLATFAATAVSPIAQSILEIAADAGYEDVEELALDMAEALGISDGEAAGLLTGEFVPDEEMAGAIAEAFELDDESGEIFVGIAEETLDAIESDEDDDDEEEGEEQGFSRYEASRISELETQIAEFQATSEINSTLLNLERRARLGMENGWLPPVVGEMLFGNFELDEDRVAAFSQVCQGNQVTPETELYSLDKALDVFEQLGPIWAQFGAIVDAPLSQSEVENQQSVNAQARRNHELRKQRMGLAQGGQET